MLHLIYAMLAFLLLCVCINVARVMWRQLIWVAGGLALVVLVLWLVNVANDLGYQAQQQAYYRTR